MLRRALAPAAVLLLAAACSGRANDLDTYYDEPTPDVAAAAPTTTAPPVSGPRESGPRESGPRESDPRESTTPASPTTTTAPVTTTTEQVADPAGAVLTSGDLAEEGVQAVSGQVDAAAGCAADASGHWRYPSGSEIEQTVALLPDAADRVARMRDEGACLPDAAADGPELGELGDARHSWCYETPQARGCGAAVADGDLLTVVIVEAGSTQRAGEAVARIAPLAAEALGRVQGLS